MEETVIGSPSPPLRASPYFKPPLRLPTQRTIVRGDCMGPAGINVKVSYCPALRKFLKLHMPADCLRQADSSEIRSAPPSRCSLGFWGEGCHEEIWGAGPEGYGSLMEKGVVLLSVWLFTEGRDPGVTFLVLLSCWSPRRPG